MQQASYEVVECVVHYLNLNVIVSFFASICTSSPTAGCNFSYSSSVRHITALVIRLFMGWYIDWMSWYAS